MSPGGTAFWVASLSDLDAIICDLKLADVIRYVLGNDSQILRGLCSHKSSLDCLSKDWFCGGGSFNLGQTDRAEADCAVPFPVQLLAKLELEMSSIYSKYEGLIVTFAWRELNKQMKRGTTNMFDR